MLCVDPYIPQVLTTYDVLRSELHLKGTQRFNLRDKGRPRGKVRMSLLRRIEWWRLILDEAQAVKGRMSSYALMATELQAKNRW